MSDEIRKMIEEATKESLMESFTEAGRKYIAAAEASEKRGDFEGSQKLYEQAAETFLKAAEKYRSSKSYKNAALNMCAAGDLYSELADSAKAISAYSQAAEDLYGASSEHLMWGEDKETKKGTALAVVASLIYIMIGKEADGFYRARSFSAENASKIRFPEVIRLSQIPQMLETAIQSVDLDSFATAENPAITELKSSLASANAQQFSKYVDKGLDMVREILRGKLKVPKIVTQLDLPVDMTFSEEVPLKLVIQNNGDGEALNLSAEWFFDDGLDFVSGEKSKQMPVLPPGQSVTLQVHVKSSQELTGVKEYSIMVRGSYKDKLNTEFSLQAGPGTLVLKDYKESEKLLQAIDVTSGRVGLLDASIGSSQLEEEPLRRIASGLSDSLKTARDEITDTKLESAKARIKVVNDLVDIFDSVLGDETLTSSIIEARESEKRDFAAEKLAPLVDSVRNIIDAKDERLKTETTSALQAWDVEAEKKKETKQSLSSIVEQVSGLIGVLDSVYSMMPSASSTDDPELATKRTKIRTELDSVKSKLQEVYTGIEGINTSAVFEVGSRPETPAKVTLASELLKSVKNEIVSLIESKKNEMS